MANILLIRHGQAGFGKLNYDQLSDLGWQQAERLGKALTARGFEAGWVFYGSMRRHQETFLGAKKHWQSFGPVAELSGFNEFNSDDVIACAFPQFKHKAALGAWLLTQEDKRKAFQELFAKAVELWISGEHDNNYQESWPHFQQRVLAALKQATHDAQGKDIAIFTSGGPITVIAQHCLGLNNSQAFELNWMMVNASLTQCLYSKNNSEKIGLASFNEQQHLRQAGPQFMSYR
ncbi:MAG: hypothetical protein RL217_331 [Pseudomonadota bacterium]|jgi:broad specificity phosphatase PhoE